ncbi:MAG: hypothetical protein ACKPEY_20410 [Planctomycetota bacterium]
MNASQNGGTAELLQPAALEQSLLLELDSRQDDILTQLDQLNTRIEGLLKDVETWRHTVAVPPQ